MAFLQDRRLQLDFVQQKLAVVARGGLEEDARRFASLAAALDALSPLKVLGRGYAMVQLTDGTILRESGQTTAGDRVRIQLARGSLGCTVDTVDTEE
jgi:exodeoxyribonuclease VII large subunit